MFIVDFTIIGVCIFKFLGLGAYCWFKQEWRLFHTYCRPFEIFLVIMLSHSIIGYIVCHNISSILKSAQDVSATDFSKPITADLGKIAIIKTTFERGLNVALVQIILCGTLIIHFSSDCELSWNPSTISIQKNKQKSILEKKGFLLTSKLPYIYERVVALG